MSFRRYSPAIALAVIVVFLAGCSFAPTQHPRDNSPLFQSAWQLEDSGKKQEAFDELKRIASEQSSKNQESAAKTLYEAGLLASERLGDTPQAKARGSQEGAALWQQVARDYPNTEAAKYLTQQQPDAPQGRLAALYQHMAAAERDNPAAAAEALYEGGLFASEKFTGATQDERHNAELAAAQMWRQLDQDFPNTPAAQRLREPAEGKERGRLASLIDRIDRRNSKDWRYVLLHTLVSITGSQPAFSYAFALILLAIVVKLLTFPLTLKQYKGMRDMMRIQPLVKELQKKYKGTELHEKTLALYKEHNVNMFGGCLPMLVQLPFLWFIFAAIQKYEFAFAHGHFLWVGSPLAEQGMRFLGHNLIARSLADPDIPLLAIYAVSMYVTTRLTPASDPAQQQQQQTMALFMSGFFFFMFLSYRWSSAFVLYWFIQNLLSIWQQYEYIYKPVNAERAAAGTAPSPAAEGAKNGAGAAPAESRSISEPKPGARVKPRKKKR